MNTLPDVITTNVTVHHFLNSEGYLSIHNCPLALSLKNKIKGVKIVVGGRTVNIGSEIYRISENWKYAHGIVADALTDRKRVYPVRVRLEKILPQKD